MIASTELKMKYLNFRHVASNVCVCVCLHYIEPLQVASFQISLYPPLTMIHLFKGTTLCEFYKI